MRRRSEIERVQEESELVLDLLFAQAECGEYPALQAAVVDANAAASQLLPVHDQVVGPRSERQQFFDVFRIEIGPVRRRERMMAGGDPSFFGGLEQGKVRDPDGMEAAAGNQPETVGQVEAQLAQGRRDHGARGIGDHDQDVSVGDAESFPQPVQFPAAEELHDIGLQDALFGPHPRHAFGAERRSDLLGVFVLQNILAEPFGLAFDVDPLDASAALQDLAEDRVAGFGE